MTDAVTSMTGFSDANLATELGAISVELKAVNGRFLDLCLRLPDELRQCEQTLRERISAAVTRGKIECRISLARDPSSTVTQINHAVLAQVAELWRQVQVSLPQAAPLGAADILRWPGVIDTPTATQTTLWQAPLLRALELALADLQAARAREGAALRAALLLRCQAIEAILEDIRSAVPRMLVEAERRLRDRFASALGQALASSVLSREEINDRIRQELSLHGMRADVTEELDRLLAHVVEVRRVLHQGGVIGRRLDFLMQELNREANTLGAKASAVDMTSAAVELKLLIEQMREQVQNIE